MSRTKEYRISMRKNKIRNRKEKILKFGSGIHCAGKINKIIDENPGYLNKCHYGGFRGSLKTKTKNSYASYRHKGGYGKAVLYSRHDKTQIISMEQALSEYENGSN